MSESTKYHARLDTGRMTNEELAAEIARLEVAPEWKGVEFGDVRVRHNARVRLETYREVLAERASWGGK